MPAHHSVPGSTGILEQPLLYLSAYLHRHKSLYFDNLMRVRTHNDLTQWIKFFLAGAAQTAEVAANTLKRILALKHRIEGESIPQMGKRTPSAITLLQGLFRKPVVSVRDVQNLTGLSPKAAGDLVAAFSERSILVETTGYQRNRSFVFKKYVGMFQ